MPQHADELSLLQAQMVYKKRLEAVMAELRSQEAPLLEKVRHLEEIMHSEQKDVDRLEGRSLAVFLYTFLGKHEQMLDKERQEAYAARVRCDAARRELDAIQEDIRETEEDLRDLQDCESRYARALEEKSRALEAAGTPNGSAVLEKQQSLRYLEGQEQELAEAIEAGTASLRTLSQVLSSLNSAKDWSHLDVLGGGFLTDMAKHEKLDEAQRNIETLQVQLQKFNRELSDVTIRPELQVGIDRMLKFADFFFDGLLADLTVLDTIKSAYAQAEQTREQILGILRQLQSTLEHVRHSRQKAARELEELILNAEL